MQTFGSSGGAWSAKVLYDFNLYFWVHIHIGTQSKQHINQNWIWLTLPKALPFAWHQSLQKPHSPACTSLFDSYLEDILTLLSFWKLLSCISAVQFSSVTQSGLTLGNPRDCSTPGFPVHHQLELRRWCWIKVTPENISCEERKQSNFVREERDLDSERESLHSTSELWFTLKSENASCSLMSDSLRPHGL